LEGFVTAEIYLGLQQASSPGSGLHSLLSVHR